MLYIILSGLWETPEKNYSIFQIFRCDYHLKERMMSLCLENNFIYLAVSQNFRLPSPVAGFAAFYLTVQNAIVQMKRRTKFRRMHKMEGNVELHLYHSMLFRANI
jgi:hypothetical protein